MFDQVSRSPSARTFLRLVILVMVAVIANTMITKGAQANPKYAGIVIDANTGETLYSYRGDSIRYPASLTKMMTLYMMFEAVEQGKLSESTRIRVSSHAASMVPSKLGIRPGGTISAGDAMLALITKSANDVAAAVAEHLGGTESGFAKMMTDKARALGMSKTVFRNASGLPNSSQVTTARDMARLGIALQEHFPRQFKKFTTSSFTYAGARYTNHNRLLGRIKGVDGIKTGYTRASGFNLVTSVNRDGRSIVAVVLGGRSGASRNAQMEKLIAEHLHKGSRKDSGPLIARNGTSRFKAPVGASLASMDASQFPIPTLATRAGSLPAGASAYVEPVARPAAPVATQVASIDPVVTASAPQRTGWVIQIASLPSHEDAIDFLDNASRKAASVVSGRDPFVEEFTKGGTVYHRARFAGFASKSEAWAACAAIKKYDYACLAQEL